MKNTLNPSRGSEIFMIDLKLYTNKITDTRKTTLYIDLPMKPYIKKSKVFKKYMKNSYILFYTVITRIMI